MEGLEDLEFAVVSCSDSATFGITTDGRVFGCGTFRVFFYFRFSIHFFPLSIQKKKKKKNNLFFLNLFFKKDDNGVMGFSEGVRNQATMTEIQTLKTMKIIGIAAGPNICSVLSTDGNVYTFGCGVQQTGNEEEGKQSVSSLGRSRVLRFFFFFFFFPKNSRLSNIDFYFDRGRGRTLNAAALNFGPKKKVGKITKISCGT